MTYDNYYYELIKFIIYLKTLQLSTRMSNMLGCLTLGEAFSSVEANRIK